MNSVTNEKINKNKWFIALVILAISGIGVLLGVFDRLEMAMYDSWFRLRGVRDPGRQVVIIGMDEASYQKLGPPAWPRTVHAQLLEKLREAKAVAFDLTFDVPTKPGEDAALGEAIARHGRVVLASQFVFDQASGQVEQVFQPPCPEIMAGAAGLGFVNTPTDPDGVVRHITAVDVNTFEMPFPSLGLATALTAVNLKPTNIKYTPGLLTVVGRSIPLNKLNQAMPEFWGPQRTFKTYSYADVVGGKYPASEFKDKIILIGPTASISKDSYPTPYTTSNLILSGALETPGVEIHAAVVQSFLDGRWYRRVSPGINLLFLVLVGILSTLAVSGRGPWLGLAGALAMVAVVVGIVYGLWSYYLLWLNVAAPLVLIFMTYGVMTAADFVQAEVARRRTRAMFSRYVSAGVVEELMNNSGELKLGGRRVTITIIFCDIRGFTAYSENKAPEQVVSRLNEYLTAMTEIIFRNGGTLDKYLGDGLMAFFGAPVYYPDHIERAIRTAVEIQDAIGKLNDEWAAKGEPPLNIGVGMNSGSVLVGNVGSPERMDYTVIGEDVNLASRVEGLTKTFGTLIVISERTVKMLGEGGARQLPWQLRHLGHAEVKGFTDPIGVYTIVTEIAREGDRA
ncbi:CHASE2 domain-containing protein [Desulfotruncus alcoholivorax]|uniref:CHASE2 domain-containing protein n=1 Tax=Desulfotruncus alcoholivorax TaxID=265477 RepID=UPI000411D94B|nr:adenylate/guanylate cyclase domain-containing protein [Desulfotruncus alcoholivorax]